MPARPSGSHCELPPETGAHTWVILPTFNEAPVVAETILGLGRIFPNIVLVDDGSTDATAALAAASGAAVCRHIINLGQGAALQTGFDYALRNGARYVVTFDADGQHEPEDARNMVLRLIDRKLDVVLGSRFLLGPPAMPLPRRLLLRLAIVFTRWTTGLRVTDTHNGLRVLSAAAASRIHLQEDGFAHASEILSQIAKLEMRYEEAPCDVRYTAYSRKKGQRWSGAFRILADLGIARLYRR